MNLKTIKIIHGKIYSSNSLFDSLIIAGRHLKYIIRAIYEDNFSGKYSYMSIANNELTFSIFYYCLNNCLQ